MNNALIVSSNEQGSQYLLQHLKEFRLKNISCAKSGCEARRLFSSSFYDLIVINAPLSDEFGHELALNISSGGYSSALLIVKGEFADEIAARVEEGGVFVMAKPINSALLAQAMRFIFAARYRLKSISKQLINAQSKLDDVRIISKAKCLLVEKDGMTESEAHKYIEKEAMDTRVSSRAVAEQILKYYEN